MRVQSMFLGAAMLALAGCAARLPNATSPASASARTTVNVPRAVRVVTPAPGRRMAVAVGSPDAYAASEMVVVQSRATVSRPTPAPVPRPVRRVVRRRTVQTAVAAPVTAPRTRTRTTTSGGCAGGT